MQQKPMSLIEFQRKFATEKACQGHLFRLRWPEGYHCPRCHHHHAYFHRTRHLYQCKACGYQVSLTAGTIFHKTRTPLRKWFWMIFLMGRQKSGISMLSLKRMLEIKGYKTAWTMGHKIRKAMADREASYKLAGLIEMDDSYFGASKPGKRGRGAAGKAKVVVSVEIVEEKPGFAKMQQVHTVSAHQIREMAHRVLDENVVVRTDGWRAYRVLNNDRSAHKPVVVRFGANAVKVLPWVHTLIANIKGNIRGVYHGVSNKHLDRYLAEFCYRSNRRFWENQMFDRILAACVGTSTVSYSELRA
ncbi:MAG: IS1595 family transposase [Desulfobacteraceae bacterium]|nr:IS1595 family transposase [Desulfobacteraceae bacterium]